jgi:hypothetical protein
MNIVANFGRELGDVDVAFEIRRYEGTEIICAVLSEGLHREDASVVDNDINRAKLLNSGVDHFLSSSRLADVSSTNTSLSEAFNSADFVALREVPTTATFQERPYYCSADSLGGARQDYRLLSTCHIWVLLPLCGCLPRCSRSVPYSFSCSHRALGGHQGSLRCCSQCLSAWLDAEEAPQVPEVGQLRPPQRAQLPETTSLPSHRRTREESQTPHLFRSNSRWSECWHPGLIQDRRRL